MDHSEILSTQPPTLVKLLRGRASTQPDRLAYTFLKDDLEEARLTYAELDARVRCIAGKLQSLVGFGERVVLFYQPGLNFVSAFWACLYSGVIPIPVPPKPNLIFGKAQSIIKDAQPALFLTEASLLPALEKAVTQFPDFAAITRVPTDRISADFQTEYRAPQIPGSHLALLQYTSGSTSEPKGVMVSHENILRNSLALDLGWNHTAESAIVSWLPHFHDMGFIYGLIQPVYAGISCYFMSPFSFIQQPFRWLQAITRYRGTHSAAPNFAYDLCTHQITDTQ